MTAKNGKGKTESVSVEPKAREVDDIPRIEAFLCLSYFCLIREQAWCTEVDHPEQSGGVGPTP